MKTEIPTERKSVPDKMRPGKSILYAILGVAVFVACSLLSGLVRLLPLGVLGELLQGLVFMVSLYLLYRLLGQKLLGSEPAQMGLRDPKHWWPWLLFGLALPLALYAFYGVFVPGDFSLLRPLSVRGLLSTTLFSAFGVGLVAGVTEEMAFRGFIYHALELGFGKRVAVLAPALLFGLLHIANIGASDSLSVFLLVLAGTSVGILFGLVRQASGSAWAAALVHGIWNFAVIGNLASIEPGPIDPLVRTTIAFALPSDGSILLSGGDFGVEASLLAILIYWLGIALLYSWIKRKHDDQT